MKQIWQDERLDLAPDADGQRPVLPLARDAGGALRRGARPGKPVWLGAGRMRRVSGPERRCEHGVCARDRSGSGPRLCGGTGDANTPAIPSAQQRDCGSHPGHAGIRCARPPWEALVTFILSANNNVTRIRELCLETLQTIILAQHARPHAPRGALFPTPARPAPVANCPEETAARPGCVGYRATGIWCRRPERVAGGLCPWNALAEQNCAYAGGPPEG